MLFLFTLLDLYSAIIIIRALVSWFEPNPYNIFYRFLVESTEPVLRPLRRVVPPRRTAGIDLSPVLALFLIHVLKVLLISILM